MLHLQARHLGNRGTAEATEQSIVLYQQALAVEPGYAAAWSGLANSYLNLYLHGQLSRQDSTRLAREASQRALELDADRLEIANVQYYGWALINRTQLMPAWDDVMGQVDIVEKARERLRGILLIDFVTPDYYAEFPKPCMGGWAQDAFMITPDGTAMPCHAAHTIPHLKFDNVKQYLIGL